MKQNNIPTHLYPPVITWIIPVYNGEKYLAQAITSVLNQPCIDSKVIIVDDGSTDHSLSIARSFECDRVSVIHKENGGVSSARNLGIKAADSTYLAFLDADDVLCKDIFDDSISSLLTNETYDLISFSHYVADQNLKNGRFVPVEEGKGTNCAASIDHFKHCSSFIYHHRLFEGENGIRFPDGIRVREDVTFQFLANRKTQNYLSINRGLFIHRNNILSVMHNLSDTRYLVQDVIPAWVWCKELSPSNADKEQCDILIFAEAVSYLQLSCMDGVRLSEIQKTLLLPAIQQSLSDYDKLWKSRRLEYESFLAAPQNYWLKYRMRGIIFKFLRFIVRLPLIRILYMKMRYSDPIERYIQH